MGVVSTSRFFLIYKSKYDFVDQYFHTVSYITEEGTTVVELNASEKYPNKNVNVDKNTLKLKK